MEQDILIENTAFNTEYWGQFPLAGFKLMCKRMGLFEGFENPEGLAEEAFKQIKKHNDAARISKETE